MPRYTWIDVWTVAPYLTLCQNMAHCSRFHVLIFYVYYQFHDYPPHSRVTESYDYYKNDEASRELEVVHKAINSTTPSSINEFQDHWKQTQIFNSEFFMYSAFYDDRKSYAGRKKRNKSQNIFQEIRILLFFQPFASTS